jgi:hypothetical protein
MNRMALFRGCRQLAVALMLCVVGSAASRADANLSGDYDVAGRTLHGRAYTGEVRIAPHGKGYAIAWRLDEGDTYRGMALKVDNVLGAVYWSERDDFRGRGLVVYRIVEGGLEGIWLPVDADGRATGRENLKGSPDLTGDYEITLGENPDGLTNYDGHVHMERHGDVVQLAWYTPQLSYVGNGVRIGDLLVVGYALQRAPGTIGYCVERSGLHGFWTYGDEAALAHEMLKRHATVELPSPEANANPGACPAAATP